MTVQTWIHDKIEETKNNGYMENMYVYYFEFI